MSPTYRPAGEDGPNALMAQAAQERYGRPRVKGESWTDPIKPGWPGPRRDWTPAMVDAFDRAMHDLRQRGWAEPVAYAEAWGVVTRMPEGRARR